MKEILWLRFLNTVDDFIDAICSSFLLSVYSVLAILHIEPLLTPIWTKSNDFTGIHWWITGLQNYIDAIAEIFYLTSKKISYLLYGFFFIGYIQLL